MPAAARLGDKDTGHGSFPPRANVEGSPNVLINGIPAHRVGDAWPAHSNGKSSHPAVTAAGSATVFVNGKALARVGDPLSCGGTIAEGSGTVFAN